MARILIVGCGCRGQTLARALVARGDAVRGTTRDPARAAAIEASGAEAVVADPDRVGTLYPALAGVSAVCLLLGSVQGPPEQVRALHSERLEMLLLKLIDTSVRGVVYEAAGSVEPPVLRRGGELVALACERSHVPYALLEADAAGAWPAGAVDAIDSVLRG